MYANINKTHKNMIDLKTVILNKNYREIQFIFIYLRFEEYKSTVEVI